MVPGEQRCAEVVNMGITGCKGGAVGWAVQIRAAWSVQRRCTESRHDEVVRGATCK